MLQDFAQPPSRPSQEGRIKDAASRAPKTSAKSLLRYARTTCSVRFFDRRTTLPYYTIRVGGIFLAAFFAHSRPETCFRAWTGVFSFSVKVVRQPLFPAPPCLSRYRISLLTQPAAVIQAKIANDPQRNFLQRTRRSCLPRSPRTDDVRPQWRRLFHLLYVCRPK